MAENIPEAFQALHERWEAIFAKEQARLAALSQDGRPITVDDVTVQRPFYQGLDEMRADRVRRDNLTPHGAHLSVSSEGTALWTPDDVRQMGGRSVGYDGPEDVRIPQEYGPPSGSLEAALEQIRLDEAMERHEPAMVREEEPLLLQDALRGLQARLAGLAQAPPAEQTQQRGQGMGY